MVFMPSALGLGWPFWHTQNGRAEVGNRLTSPSAAAHQSQDQLGVGVDGKFLRWGYTNSNTTQAALPIERTDAEAMLDERFSISIG